MTQQGRATLPQSAASLAPVPRAKRSASPKAAGITSGGVLLACIALVVTLSTGRDAPKATVPPLAAADAGPSKLRIAAAPSARPGAAGAGRSSGMPDSDASHGKSGRLAAVHAPAPRADRHRLAHAAPGPDAPLSHLLASAGFGPSKPFVPMTAWTLPADAAFVAPEPALHEARFEVAALTPAEIGAVKRLETLLQPKAPERADSPAADPEPAHVEMALPDLPAAAAEAASAPASARDAIERELDLAVPKPTARPFRQPSTEAAGTEAVRTSRRDRAPAALLAYARPDAGALGSEPPAIDIPMPAGPAISAGTAVYDISAATVYLPNGERLEAHSGLGTMRDDIRFVHQKNRGPTPPHTYDLTLRESLFHGVAAIRLNPVGGERFVHNRVGLLAHTYMLGPRGDSNGCVSFKDYKRFLAAFKRGEIRRLVVVPSYKRPTSRLASLFSRGKT